ncbi:AAA family ATPase [Thermococcus sp.]
MISYLEIGNFRGIESLKLENLGQINVIVGKNNSGKSSVLEALALVLGAKDGPKILETSLREILIWRGWYGEQTANDLFYRNSKSFKISIKERTNNKQTVSETEGYNNTCVTKKSGALKKSQRKSTGLFFGEDEEKPFIHIPRLNAGLIRDYNYFSIRIRIGFKDEGYVSSINKTAIVSKNTISEIMLSSVFHPEASFEFLTPLTLRKANYVETLYSYAYENKIIHQAIKSLKLAYPDIENFSPLLKYDKWVLYVETSQGVYPYYVMGEGFKNVLLISLITALRGNGYLLIDSAEAFHHPKSLRVMVKTLIEGANTNNVQVFLTTHSLELLDMLLEYGISDDIDGRVIHMKRENKNITAKVETFERANELRETIGLDLRG